MTIFKKLSELFLINQNLNCEGLQTNSVGNKPATQNEIELVKNLVPNDYIEFLKLWNGCSLFNLENQAGFTFFGALEIVNETNNFKEIYDSDWDESIVLFCSNLGSGDFIGFRVNESGYEIVDCCHDDLPADWIVITNSFDQFTNGLIDGKGDKYWLKF